MAAVFPVLVAIGRALLAAIFTGIRIEGGLALAAYFRVRLPPGVATVVAAKSFAAAALFLSDRLFAVWAKTMLFFNYLNVFLHRFWRPGQMVPFAITFDRIDAKQQFAGDGFISESLQPEFVYGFFLRRRHQTASFGLLSQRYTFSRNKKCASALSLQGLRIEIVD